MPLHDVLILAGFVLFTIVAYGTLIMVANPFCAPSKADVDRAFREVREADEAVYRVMRRRERPGVN